MVTADKYSPNEEAACKGTPWCVILCTALMHWQASSHLKDTVQDVINTSGSVLSGTETMPKVAI